MNIWDNAPEDAYALGVNKDGDCVFICEDAPKYRHSTTNRSLGLNLNVEILQYRPKGERNKHHDLQLQWIAGAEIEYQLNDKCFLAQKPDWDEATTYRVKSELVPHVHAECIKEWADGKTIQVRTGITTWWDLTPTDPPKWNTNQEYRVKP